MKKITLLFSLLLVALLVQAQQAKYVFYFIGDGMGVNQVLAAETYLSELKGEIGHTPLLFTQFPYATSASTNSATNGVTDSAAAGTALATGYKTVNGALGVLKDKTTPVTSVAVWAKNAGARVAITTSVSVDHATPASFYAHQPSRNNYYQIGHDLVAANFDFYAGSGFQDPTDKKHPEANSTDLFTVVKDAGYTVARGYKDYVKKAKKAEKMLLVQPEGAADASSIPYAIDRKKGDLSLPEITRAGINFMTKDLSKGFFMMVEGGKIDYACHPNDGATAIQEIIDMDEAVKVAYEFYAQHPDETLIVVAADHETGGMSIGNGGYDSNLQAFKYQKVSEAGMTTVINNLRAKYKNQVTWEMAQEALKENFGFWDGIKLNEKQEARLKAVYEKSFGDAKVELSESLYQRDEPLAHEAKKIINEIGSLGWTTGSHTAGLIPVFAIGAGADLFIGRLDNTEIAPKIAQAAGWKAE